MHDNAGRTVKVGALLFEALDGRPPSRPSARGGAVDPTIGNAIAALGYDADLDEVRARPAAPPRALGPVAGYAHVQLNRARPHASASRAVSVSTSVRPPRRWRPTGPRPASPQTIGDGRAGQPRWRRRRRRAAARRAGGPSASPASHRPRPTQVDQVVAITHGGLASSATSVRTWTAG